MRRTVVLLAALVPLLAGCGASGGEVRADGSPESSGRSQETSGTIIVGIDETVGHFIEGFDVALRFETGAGDVVRATSWVQFVIEDAGEDPSLETFYGSKLEQAMPVGPVVLLAETFLGNEDGSMAEVDPEGALPCRLELDLGPDQVVDVEVDFDRPGMCLRQVLRDVPAPSTTVGPTEPPSTTEAETAPTTVLPSSTTPASSPPTSTELPVGSQHYVDVDLMCEAFELGGGTWILVDGDPSSWQPAGERHEGGTFTVDTPTMGTFRGDVEGVKSGTFRRLGPDEAPSCEPQPR